MALSITNVLLLDNVDPSAKEILERNGIKANLCKEKFSASALVTELQKYDGVVVRSATTFTDDIIKACPKLSIIGRAGTGVDNIDITSATRHGIAVMNTPSGNTISAAEHTCTLICCLSRNVPAADAHVKSGKWERKQFMGHELMGKTLGIVGLGRIGLEVAKRMQSFGMRTIGFDPIVSAEDARKYDVEWMSLEEIWPKVDYITVHTPLIPQTKGLINSKVFNICKKGVRVINCARGGIIDESCLLEALESGQCGGAGLDVFVDEPTSNTALVNHPKVVACPHLGASTKEGQARCGSDIAQQFVDARDGKSYFGILNAPALTAALSESSKVWVDTAHALGKVLRGYFAETKGLNVVLHTSGEDLKRIGKALIAGVSSGLVANPNCNLINANVLLSECGANLSLQNLQSGADLFEVEATCGERTLRLSARVSEKNPVLQGVNGSSFSAAVILKGLLLIYQATSGQLDVLKGVLGILSDAGISMKSLSLTDPSSGSQWAVMHLSQCPSSIQNILPKVSHAFLVEL